MYGKSLFRGTIKFSLISVRSSHKGSTKRLLDFLASMSKSQSSKTIDTQRPKTSKSEKYAPSKVYLQVLGSGARGAPNTLYMFSDQKRYLFNCGECTQRLAHEHKVKLSKLNHIFITNKTWRNIGGLPGLSLTLQDVGVPNITLHGPHGLEELYDATKRFVKIKDMEVSIADCNPTIDFEDNVMTVKYIILSRDYSVLDMEDMTPNKRAKMAEMEKENEDFKEFIMDDIDYYSHKSSVNKLNKKGNKNDRSKSPTKTAKPLTKYKRALSVFQKGLQCTVAYVCTLKKRLGTLDLEKCVERGVKPGPMLALLKNGRDVVLPDGSVVLASEVKTPDEPGPIFIVLEVPHISYLKESEFSQYFDNGVNSPEDIPALVVHFTPPQVFNMHAYQKFIKKFGTRTQHLILNSQNTCLGSEAVHRTQHRLHLLDPDIFPLLRDVSIPTAISSNAMSLVGSNDPKSKCYEELKNKFQRIIDMESTCKGLNRGDAKVENRESYHQSQREPEIHEGRTLSMFHLRPKREFDRSQEPKLHLQEYIQETMDAEGVSTSLKQFRRLVESIKSTSTSSEYPKIVFFGTGSCIPSKTRNTSAIVVHVDEESAILLDCGEGTFSQIVRFYGQKRIDNFLRTIKAIYISHLHADHHIGLITLLQERRAALDDLGSDSSLSTLYLLAPGQIMTWLSIYDEKFEGIRNEFTLVPNQSLMSETDAISSELTPHILSHLGVADIRTCLVSHCPNAFGVSMQIRDFKLTYSGDTIPCEELVQLGKDSTILIHEATMEDELEDEARIKMHTTTSQAIEIGKKMNAKFTILTHFSQRYARLPRLSLDITTQNKAVGIAFDYMRVTLEDLELLPHMYDPLRLMFAEHCVEMDMKAAHRAQAKARAQIPPMEPGTKRKRLNIVDNTNVDKTDIGNSGVNAADDENKMYKNKIHNSEKTVLDNIHNVDKTDVNMIDDVAKAGLEDNLNRVLETEVIDNLDDEKEVNKIYDIETADGVDKIDDVAKNIQIK